MKAKIIDVDEAKQLLDYDPATGVFRWRLTRRSRAAGKVVGSQKKDGYIHISLEGKRYLAHRLAYAMTHNEQPPNVDHINGVKTDNRIANLRAATRRLNQENRTTSLKSSKTGVLGVHLSKDTKKYHAHIQSNKRSYFLGAFTTIEEASAAYVDAKRRLHAGCTI